MACTICVVWCRIGADGTPLNKPTNEFAFGSVLNVTFTDLEVGGADPIFSLLIGNRSMRQRVSARPVQSNRVAVKIYFAHNRRAAQT